MKWLYKLSRRVTLNAALICIAALTSIATAYQSQAASWPELPEAVSNNAVAQVEVAGDTYLLSFMGLGPEKDHHAVHNKVWRLKLGDSQWQQVKSVPSSLPLPGRLASIAVGIADKAYVFGGFTVAEDHSEISSPDNFVYDLSRDQYQQIAPMPVAVDDAVALVYQNRYIYLISGWHNSANVNLVQVYDSHKDSWQQATPYLGKAVFGHAGAIVEQQMLVCDGVIVAPRFLQRRTFRAEAACYLGIISTTDHLRIDWQKVPHPTGTARYRMAATGIQGEQTGMVFIGGSDNPYNYDGIGYNGTPSEPSNSIWFYDLNQQHWRFATSHQATMDHRSALTQEGKVLIIGGMQANQQVSKRLTTVALPLTLK